MASRRTGKVCQLLVFLFSAGSSCRRTGGVYCSHSTKVWWWVGEGIDFRSSLCIGFWGGKSHKLGASLCLSHSSLLFFLPCGEFSLLDNFRPGRFSASSLSLVCRSVGVVPFWLSLSPVPLDWSMEKGKAG